MNLKDLKKPFPANKIRWRVGRKTKDKSKATPFAYIDARDVMERLDEVCEVDGWQARYPFTGCCEIGVRVPFVTGASEDDSIKTEWIWKANGVGEVFYGQNDTADTKEMKAKGQYSDAFKRAAVLFGIGQYLYDMPLDKVWLPVGEYGYADNVIDDLTDRYQSWIEKNFKQEGE